MSTPPADYDTPWKEALQEYFEPFLRFFFPDVHALIDWSRLPISLEKELQQIVGEAESEKRLADKLFQAWLLDGEEVWVLIHVEIQSQVKLNFPKRMYQYNYRTFDRYERPVISLAVLGDEQISWRPSSSGYALGGSRVSLEFPIVKLLDYKSKWEELEQSSNPFAIMVMAHLKTQATSGKPSERKQWKGSLIRKPLEKGYSRKDVELLFRLIDEMMSLSKELERELRAELRCYQEEKQMPFMSPIEMLAKEEGIEEGIQQGIQQGILRSLRENVRELLEIRFTEVPAELREEIDRIEDVSLLKQLLRETIAVNSIAEFQQLITQKDIIEEGG